MADSEIEFAAVSRYKSPDWFVKTFGDETP